MEEKSLPVGELLQELLPDRSDKWREWEAALFKEDIEHEGDVLKVDEEDFNHMRVSAMLKTALRAHRTAKYAEMKSSSAPKAAKSKTGPRVCHVSVRILALSDIDMTKNSFKVELILFLLWDDDVLKPGSQINWQKAWQPRVTIANCKEVEDDFFTREATDPKLIKLPMWHNHKVLHARKFYLTLSQLYELKRFPFDVQLLQIVFRPAEHKELIELKTMNQMAFRNSISPMVGNMATEWIIHYPQDEEAIDDYSLNRPYSLYVVSIPIERHPGFYMYNVVALMFILGSVGLGTFTLSVDMAHVRADLLLTLVLTLVALKLVTNERLPQITYLTWLDYYMLLTLMFQVTQLACNFYLALQKGDEMVLLNEMEHVQKLDKMLLWTLVGTWGMMHIMILIAVVRWRQTTMYLLDRSNNEWEESQKTKKRSNSVIGGMSPLNKGGKEKATQSTFQIMSSKDKGNAVRPAPASSPPASPIAADLGQRMLKQMVLRQSTLRKMNTATRGVGREASPAVKKRGLT
jgi:hypothetical protein